MNSINHKNLVLIIMMLLIILLLGACGSEMEEQRNALDESLKPFYNALADDDLCGMTLKVYDNGACLTPRPITVDELISYAQANHTIDNTELQQHIDLLKQITAEKFIPVEKDSVMDATACFIFETDKNEKLLEIVLGGISENTETMHDYESPDITLFINGIEVQYAGIFDDLIAAFCKKTG